MPNNYKSAIELLAKCDLDYRQIVYRIAWSNPKVLVNAIEGSIPPIRESRKLEDEVVSLLQIGKKINAVKLWRDHTGDGLKESKDAVESIQAKRIPEYQSSF
ncbi:hypothetical protein UFOVP1244_6 [uncultured Caudovirales phage]|uniref:Uncharacterized protein n=1 Tax=uncultured Caudovirales phage TaxID=2100421 RepID=A0A6J5R5G3_9CAUD|nr:hypothetical protein UFOVP1244_6 [uncultured Caudovirales phage]